MNINKFGLRINDRFVADEDIATTDIFPLIGYRATLQLHGHTICLITKQDFAYRVVFANDTINLYRTSKEMIQWIPHTVSGSRLLSTVFKFYLVKLSGANISIDSSVQLLYSKLRDDNDKSHTFASDIEAQVYPMDR